MQGFPINFKIPDRMGSKAPRIERGFQQIPPIPPLGIFMKHPDAFSLKIPVQRFTLLQYTGKGTHIFPTHCLMTGAEKNL